MLSGVGDATSESVEIAVSNAAATDIALELHFVAGGLFFSKERFRKFNVKNLGTLPMIVYKINNIKC